MSSSDERHDNPDSGVSRRNFLKGTGVALTIPLVAKSEQIVEAAGANVAILGPDKVNITLNINNTNKTASIERGPLVSSVSATGALSAVTTVQVGTQVSGTIQKLYVDFNSRVKKGEPIAQIDYWIGFWEDLYVVLGSFDREGGWAVIKVLVNPMVAWIWMGGAIMAFGTLIALWPTRSRVTGSSEGKS